MRLDDHAQALVLLGSHLGLPADPDPAPLRLREWNALERALAASPLAGPGALLGKSAADLQAALAISEEQAERVATLLDRGGSLAIELERLESLGIWTLTRRDEAYPARLRDRLKESAPPVIFGAGPAALASRPGLAVVGSRNVDEGGKVAAEFLGNAAAACAWVLYSGGARGVDGTAMQAALQAQGQAVGILADSLERSIRQPDVRDALARDDLALVTPYHPQAGFSVGAAMGRNKLIYALADYAVVVASDANTGGTWAGASEALKAGWVPVFVCDGPHATEGNRLLIEAGGIALPMPFSEQPHALGDWFASRGAGTAGRIQRTLF